MDTDTGATLSADRHLRQGELLQPAGFPAGAGEPRSAGTSRSAASPGSPTLAVADGSQVVADADPVGVRDFPMASLMEDLRSSAMLFGLAIGVTAAVALLASFLLHGS